VSNKENYTNLYFAVIVHVPSFVFERISAALPDIGEMDIDKEASGSVKKSHHRSASEASIIRLPKKGLPVLLAVEISNIWARFYWKKNPLHVDLVKDESN